MIGYVRNHLRSSLVQNTYLLVIIRFFATGFGFFFWAMAARLVTAENMGVASGVVSATMLLAGLAQLGLGYGLVRHFSTVEEPNSLINRALVFTFVAGTLLAIIFLIGLPLWSPALDPLLSNPLTILLFIVFVVSVTITQLLNWTFLATRGLVYRLAKQVVQVVVAIGLLFVLQHLLTGYVSVVAAYAMAIIISLVLAFRFFLPKAHPEYRFNFSIDFSFRDTTAKYSLTNYAADQLSRAPDVLLPLIVIFLFGPGAGAYFFVVWMIGRSIAAWAGSAGESLFAEGSTTPHSATAFRTRSAKMGFLLAFGMTIVILIGGDLILSIYGEEYVEQGALLLRVLAISSLPTVLLLITINYFRIRDNLRGVFLVVAASTGFGLLLSYVGLVNLGLIGAGLGWLVSQVMVLLGVLGWWQGRRIIRRQDVMATSSRSKP